MCTNFMINLDRHIIYNGRRLNFKGGFSDNQILEKLNNLPPETNRRPNSQLGKLSQVLPHVRKLVSYNDKTELRMFVSQHPQALQTWLRGRVISGYDLYINPMNIVETGLDTFLVQNNLHKESFRIFPVSACSDPSNGDPRRIARSKFPINALYVTDFKVYSQSSNSNSAGNILGGFLSTNHPFYSESSHEYSYSFFGNALIPLPKIIGFDAQRFNPSAIFVHSSAMGIVEVRQNPEDGERTLSD